MKVRVCDRCSQELYTKAYKTSLTAKKPRFYWIMPTKSGASDMWELSKGKFEMCDKCTADFLIFATTPSKLRSK